MSSTIYEITIYNKSGSDQNYVLFNEQPIISNVVAADIWLNVFKKRTVADGGAATFKITKNYGAVCGSADNTPGNAVSVSVGTPMPVTLGTASPNGTVDTWGTTLIVDIANDTPRFKTVNPEDNKGAIGAFEIRTGNIDFNTARNKNWLIGLGGDTKGTGLDGPAATFVPQGHKSYQIQPVTKYWISTADYSEGSMIKVRAVADNAVSIDYSKTTLWNTKVNHDSNGKLVVQAARA